MQPNVVIAFIVALLAIGDGANASLRIPFNEPDKKNTDIACCQDDCKTAICVPPWVSICFGCANKAHERIVVNHDSSEEDVVDLAQNLVVKTETNNAVDCCENKCKTAICVPPWVAICSQCKGHLEEDAPKIEKVEIEGADDVLSAPYKHCCDESCKTQLCVPPFVAICTGCKDKRMETHSVKF